MDRVPASPLLTAGEGGRPRTASMGGRTEERALDLEDRLDTARGLPELIDSDSNERPKDLKVDFAAHVHAVLVPTCISIVSYLSRARTL